MFGVLIYPESITKNNMMLFLWLATIVTFLLGFWLGKSQKPGEDIKQQLSKLHYKTQEVKKDIQYRNIKPGPVNRPDAKQLYRYEHPEVAEEEEAMKKQLEVGIQPLTS